MRLLCSQRHAAACRAAAGAERPHGATSKRSRSRRRGRQLLLQLALARRLSRRCLRLGGGGVALLRTQRRISSTRILPLGSLSSSQRALVRPFLTPALAVCCALMTLQLMVCLTARARRFTLAHAAVASWLVQHSLLRMQ